jgi:cysteine synthase A
MREEKRNNPMMAENILELIGGTPLVKLKVIGHDLPSTIAAKLEFFNPSGSIKDRTVLSMILQAERDGNLKPGMTIVEPTSGNTGIALALICAYKGYRLIITMPDTMSIERRKLLKAFGAEVILTQGSLGMDGAIMKAEELVSSNREHMMLKQFENPANPDAHKRITSMEIWEQTDGKVDILVAGVGTGGTITGCGETLRKLKPEIKIIAVEPRTSAVLSGKLPGSHKIHGIGAGFMPKVLNRDVINEIITVTDEDAKETSRRLAREEGILAGISSGAALWGAMKVASRRENYGKLIVVIFADTGERYLSSWLWEDE